MPADSVRAPVVSVIVVAARHPGRLRRCLAAITAGHDAPAIEVIVVLNAAEDGMAELVERDAPTALTVASDVPLGFAGGVNLGARHARGRRLAIVHDDAEVRPGWLAGLLAALAAHPGTGVAGSVLLEPSSDVVQSAGAVLWADGRTSMPWAGEAPPLDTLTGTPHRDYCSSASLLVRREAWDACGGMDEELHPGQYVDVDLAMTMRRQGWSVRCATASLVEHARGGSSSSRLRTLAGRRNRAYFTAKWAADLAHQEPHADDGGALARARIATETRAAAVAVAHRDGAVSPERVPKPESAQERLQREHRQLRRDLAFKAAAITELEAALARAHGIEERADTLHRELDRVHAAHAALQAELERLRGDGSKGP